MDRVNRNSREGGGYEQRLGGEKEEWERGCLGMKLTEQEGEKKEWGWGVYRAKEEKHVFTVVATAALRCCSSSFALTS